MESTCVGNAQCVLSIETTLFNVLLYSSPKKYANMFTGLCVLLVSSKRIIHNYFYCLTSHKCKIKTLLVLILLKLQLFPKHAFTTFRVRRWQITCWWQCVGQIDLMLQLMLSENGNLYKNGTLKKLAGFFANKWDFEQMGI